QTLQPQLAQLLQKARPLPQHDAHAEDQRQGAHHLQPLAKLFVLLREKPAAHQHAQTHDQDHIHNGPLQFAQFLPIIAKKRWGGTAPQGEKRCYCTGSAAGCSSAGRGSSTTGPVRNTLEAKKGRYSTAIAAMPSSTLVQSST